MSKFRDITIGNGIVGIGKESNPLQGFGIRVIMSVDSDQPKLSTLLFMAPGKEGKKPTDQNLKDTPFYIAWNEDRNDYIPYYNGIPQGRPSLLGAESSSIKRKIKNFDLFNFSNETVKPTDILTAGQLYESVAPTLSRLITNYKYADSLIMDHDDAFGTYTQKSSNIGLIDQGPINGRNGDIIPAFISHYPYADNSGESAIIFAQEEVNYVPPGEGEEDGHFDYVPNKAVPRCLVGSTIFNEGLNVLRNVTTIEKGWYKNGELHSIFVASGQGTSKYGGNEEKPFINMAADINILPTIPGPGPDRNLSWDTSFNVNTQCFVRLPQNKEFKITGCGEDYDYNQFLVGKMPNDGEELLSVSYDQSNGFWDFICKVGAYLKKGLQVAVKIATNAIPVVKAISEAIGNEERPVLLVNGDLKLEPPKDVAASVAVLPRVTLCAENIYQSVLTQPGVQWAIAPQTRDRYNRLRGEDNVIELTYSESSNGKLWEWYTKIMAWFEKGLKVVEKVEATYFSILEVLNSQDTNGLPAVNIKGNVRIDGAPSLNGREEPSFTVINNTAYYTMGAGAKDDTEIATHAYVINYVAEHSGDNVVHIDSAETITGQKTFSFCPLCYATPDGDGDLVNKKYVDDHTISKDSTGDQIFTGAAKWIFNKAMEMLFKSNESSGVIDITKIALGGLKWLFDDKSGKETEVGSVTLKDNVLKMISTTSEANACIELDGPLGVVTIIGKDTLTNKNAYIELIPQESKILFSVNPRVELVGSLSDNSLVTKSYVDSITLDGYLKLINNTDQTIKSGSIFFSDTAAKYVSERSAQNIEIDYSHIAVNNTRTTSRRNGLHRLASTEYYKHDIYHEENTNHLVIDSKYIVSDTEKGNVQCIIDPVAESFAVHTEKEKFTLGQTGISFTSVPIVTDQKTGQETKLATEAYVKKLALFKLSTTEQIVDSEPIHLGNTEIDFGNDVNNKLSISKDKIEIINRVETNNLEHKTITTFKGLGGAGGFNIVNEPLDTSNDAGPAAFIELMGPIYEARIGAGGEWLLFQSPPGKPDEQGLFVTHSPEVIHSSNDTDLRENQLVTKGYIDRNTISPKYSKGTDSCGNAYEQAELSFNLFDINRPFSLILRRVKNGAMYKDVIMTTEVDGRTAPIAEGGWVRL